MEAMETVAGDVLDINNIYRSYGDYKRALDGELQRSAESFVRIGYLLKVARDTDILQESGYGSVNDFAQAEYGLDKSQVSRFIRINDEFSENGYSDRLQERYRSFGYAKLSLMLLLPEAVSEELSADYSKAEIQTVKDEVDEEKKVTDLEVMMEEKDGRQQACGIFGKVLYQIGKDDPVLYLQLHDAVMSTEYDGTSRPVIEKLMDALAPAGEAIISVRIPGEGRKMLSLKGADIDPVVVDVRSGEKQSCEWDQMITEMESLCPGVKNGRETWEILYGEPFPEKKAEVAPVQPKKKPDPSKTSRVVKAKKPEKTREETVPEGSETAVPAAGQQETAEQPIEEQDMEEKEAAGVGNEESGESRAQGEACADSKPDQEHTDDLKPADEASGAAGGAGEDGAGSGEDRESGAYKEIKIIGVKKKIEIAIGYLEVDRKDQDWQAMINRAEGIIVLAKQMMELEDQA